MVRINMQDEGGSALIQGINLWTVRSAKIELSKSSGDPMLKLELFYNDAKLYDMAMLAGRGWPIGRRKLLALGMPADFQGELDPLDFVGKRVWIATVLENYTNGDKSGTRMKVDIQQLSYSGYQPESMRPAGAVHPDDDAPF
jgi:hypothetical protein